MEKIKINKFNNYIYILYKSTVYDIYIIFNI